MVGLSEAIRAFGTTGECRGAVVGELARMARELRARAARTVGLVPAGDDVAVPGLAIGLGRALGAAGGGPVAIVDATGTWGTEPASGEVAGAGADLRTTWLLPGLALVSLRPRRPGMALVRLRAALGQQGNGFASMVVDLSGFDRAGDHFAAYDLLDALVLVARSGRTVERQVDSRLSDFPIDRALGVLLTGL